MPVFQMARLPLPIHAFLSLKTPSSRFTSTRSFLATPSCLDFSFFSSISKSTHLLQHLFINCFNFPYIGFGFVTCRCCVSSGRKLPKSRTWLVLYCLPQGLIFPSPPHCKALPCAQQELGAKASLQLTKCTKRIGTCGRCIYLNM